MTLLEALRDLNLFGKHFKGQSWKAWRVFLAALFAEAPAGDDLAVYRTCTGREAWPQAPFTEAALIVGRRGGKSRTLALIAVFLACFKDYGPFLAPGEVATIAVLAADRSQARAIFRFCLGLLRAVPLLAPMISRSDAERIVLTNRVVIEISTASFRSTRGYSYAAVLADEVAFWRSDETSANPDIEILRALRPGLASIPGAMLMLASTMWGRSELPPELGVVYSAFCDPSGGVSDAMTLAIAHLDRRSVCVLDALIDVRPPFDPEQAVARCAALLRRYGVSTVAGDKYAGEWPRARFAEHGIAFEQSARPKSDLYGDLLPLLNARRVELLDLPRLSAELAGLERRTARSGRDSIDHAPGGHDDLANAVAGVLVGLDLDRRPPLVKLGDVLDDGRPPALPTRCHLIFAVIVAVEANVAVVFTGSRHRMPPLWVLDVEAEPYYGGFFRDVARRLGELAAKCGMKFVGVPPTIFVPADLRRHVENFGFVVEETPEWFDPERSLLLAAEIIGSRRVLFTAPVVEKMKIQTIGSALAFKAGDPVETALQTALIAAICLKFDEQLTSRPRAS